MDIYKRPRTPIEKALAVNLDPRKYGTFAEIGAGQEVVRWFFQAGGSAGTISKSISAYDMIVSDAIYGKCERYVSKDRLQRMLDYEHHLNLSRLKEKRQDNTAFFVFADTVAAKSFKGNNECHGWMGVKFQSHPRDDDSQIIIHVRMLENENRLQQEALGIVGVNLVFGACFMSHEPEILLESLLDSLSPHRIEIDMISFSGIEFRHVDNRVMSLKLVELKLSEAAMFASDGEVLQPSEILRKKPVLIERGSFRPVTHVHLDMMESALKEFQKHPEVGNNSPVVLMEMTMKNLMADGEVHLKDFLSRADVLAATGSVVLISGYFEYFRVANYLRQYTKLPIAITLGVPSLRELFNEQHYENLEGGILESMGRLFKNNLLLYVYPMLDQQTNTIIDARQLDLHPSLKGLYQYLIDKEVIRPLTQFNQEYLKINSREVLKHIQDGDDAWKNLVPEKVYQIIQERMLFQ